MKNYDNEFIQGILESIDFSGIRWGVPYKIDEDTVMYMYNMGAYYKVEIDEQTEETGWYVNVIGEQVNIGTGDFEDDLRSCIWGALRDADKTRKYGPLERVEL